MAVDFYFIGGAAVQKKFDEMPIKVDLAVRQAITAMATEATRAIKSEIKGHHPMGTPTPSSAGSPPTNVTGNLRRSVRFEVKQMGFGDYYAVAGPTAIYGRALEMGRDDWGGVNYPFVAPAKQKLMSSGKLKQIYTDSIRAALA